MPPRSKRFSTEAAPGDSSLSIRNVTVLDQRTSVRMEEEMWQALLDICAREGRSVHEVCSEIARHKPGPASLTAAIRVFLLAYYRTAATPEGHRQAGHGAGADVVAAVFASGGEDGAYASRPLGRPVGPASSRGPV
ncbi:ribbon-helix-helix domain-containing protein [Oleisolibacter albus]|uniref:ribbon-helix-helix domain-containing protein n=1 Tax=Oleisolibacter albus TaxID=2171757 RepID=UPI000DF46177|nr:ribbon-helix-helix domain-containing protein [Oleisolibacter albus]